MIYQKAYQRYEARKKGEDIPLPKKGPPPNTADNVWGRVTRQPEGCWEFSGATHRNGYGAFRYNHRGGLAHRAAFESANGQIPEGLVVRHTCDNRKCCRPSLLILGTQKENIQDMLNRKRGRWAV